MRRLLVFAAIAAVAWYGWKHWTELHRAPRDEAVVVNDSGKALDRFRLMVGDQGYVREVIPAGGSVTIPFPVTHDATLGIKWQFERTDWDQTWSGGQVTAGPIRTRHHLTIEPDGGVIWMQERLATPDAH